VAGRDGFRYLFDGAVNALRFAEEVQAVAYASEGASSMSPEHASKAFTGAASGPAEKGIASASGDSCAAESAVVVSLEGTQAVIQLQKDHGERIARLDLEWENDFVPRKTLEEIDTIADHETALARVERWLSQDEASEEVAFRGDVVHDGMRNPSQMHAIRQAMTRRRLYVWGPPGTGKTATLGFIAANYLRAGKRVLFVSNTHRAVDVGLKSILSAMDAIGVSIDPERLSRLGDPVLEDPRIQEHAFDAQVERRRETNRERVATELDWMRRHRDLAQRLGMDTLPEPDDVDKPSFEALRRALARDARLNMEWDAIQEAMERLGGFAEVQARIEDALHHNERSEFLRRVLVAATLAKVCTSDLIRHHRFDAVIVDEASMASLPTLIVMASHAGSHLVIAGDPMQLPPISMAESDSARTFMETDVFTFISGASSPSELFAWQDRHRESTAFFDTQYRMRDSLAQVISSVFYEGRLVSAPGGGEESGHQEEPGRRHGGANGGGHVRGLGVASGDRRSSAAFQLIDTSDDLPFIEQEKQGNGFRPLNPVHLRTVADLIGRMLGKGYRMHDIGVIVPFRHSVWQLGRHLSREGFREVEVGTIHTFQGREKPVIIFDTVMSGERIGSDDRRRHYSVRPLDETKHANSIHVPRLLNVACTRSKDLLFIVADMDHVRRVYGRKFLGRLLERLTEA
jgi:hypothetical protein